MVECTAGRCLLQRDGVREVAAEGQRTLDRGSSRWDKSKDGSSSSESCVAAINEKHRR